MEDFHIVENATGRILQSGQAEEENILRLLGAGESFIVGRVDTGKYYYVNGVLTGRPLLPFSNRQLDVDEQYTFSRLPVGSRVYINDDMVEINDPQDTDLVWSSSTPGVFWFRFDAFPYQSLVIKVIVSD